jgi:TatD DNase family protein
MLEILSRLSPRERPGVFHSFAESPGFGAKAIDLGYRISFSGMLTFRAAENIREAARGLPLEAMLIETDAPFLAPIPHRGKTNEPSFVIETAKKLAELKNTSPEEVASRTTANFDQLFPVR